VVTALCVAAACACPGLILSHSIKGSSFPHPHYFLFVIFLHTHEVVHLILMHRVLSSTVITVPILAARVNSFPIAMWSWPSKKRGMLSQF
jgi:hypothetical protein